MTARLASAVLAKALVRLAEAAGGFGTIISKGDAEAGTLLIECREKGRFSGLYEQIRLAGDRLTWQAVGPQDIENIDEIETYLIRRQQVDPDLWRIELDIPDAPQFIAQLPPGA